MRNTNDIIRSLAVCAGPGCRGCYKLGGDAGNCCLDGLMLDARAALAAAQDRCARYAEEIMVLRERLKEAEEHG